MASINTKFSVGNIAYMFDPQSGVIYRGVVHGININNTQMDTEITYKLTGIIPNNGGRLPTGAAEYEQILYTDAEVKDVANAWLVNKSVSVFSDAGL